MRSLLRRTAALFLAVALAACGGGDDDHGTAASPTTVADAATTTTTLPFASRLCAAPAPVQAGALRNPELVELSGLAGSPTLETVLWAHNDSGDTARLFAIDHAGKPIATVALVGAEARDWEDMAAGPDALYVGDIGDNLRQRSSVAVYRVDEPDPATDTEVAATAIELTYPDDPHDAEALMVDSTTGRLVIVTKELAGTSGVYVAPLDTPGELELIATLDLGVGQFVTAGDINEAGDTIALRTYGSVFLWQREPGESLADAFAREPCEAPAPSEPQGEAIAFFGTGYVTISEGAGATVWSISASEPASRSTAGTPGTSSSG